VLECDNARLVFGFTGLASYSGFNTRRWLLDALYDVSPPDYLAKEIIDRFTEKATETFLSNRAIKRARPQDKRLSVIFSGYLYHHEPPMLGYALVSNFQDFVERRESTEANPEFHVQYWYERRPSDERATLVQRIGAWRAMVADDELELRTLLEHGKPVRAVVGKAVEVVRRMAERPAAGGTIGKQVSTIHLPADRGESVQSGYYVDRTSYTLYMPDMVVARKDRGSFAMRDFEIKKYDGESHNPLPVQVPKVGQNAPCPCGSGKKYKSCHGHWRLQDR
jgi:hypothetical protein